MISESCPCRWKGEGDLKEPTQTLSHSKKPEDQAEEREEGGRVPACGSWRRWTLWLLPFFPFTAAIALTLHYLTCEYRPALVFLFVRPLLSLKMCLFWLAPTVTQCTCLKSLPPPFQRRLPQCSTLEAAWSSQTWASPQNWLTPPLHGSACRLRLWTIM